MPKPWALAFNRRVIHPLVVTALKWGIAPPTFALLETTGRRTGHKRVVPVANGLQGNTFWLISGRGKSAGYVHNIVANPRVRIKVAPARLRDGVRSTWRSGTARLLPDDNARDRHRRLGRGRPGYRLDGLALKGLAAGGEMLTIRIDLD
ncbi:nitroreductase family deazaflavin-dependent oxidoreductase [Nocardia uniformis]|uniref:Nitroreductase family deazaflavin-dependent oxidoreductase n=1 Tax=Nocardia uniformis TaxID=53432 RepID=A0A849BUG4_9NOCA|nr:nitroreductase/quinone reductase family protein [Nocardia uniformis]NNH68496.1 nitroreductase family deazaflavin-dependent oxidoreductase [Nocardia uniformis]